MAGALYIIATPIGNLEDITLRAFRVLKEADLILAEDTRKTDILLKYYDIKTPILSYHQHSDQRRMDEVLFNIVAGKNIALVTDAGTPGISDPGNELISYLLEKEPNINVVPIPGPSALTAALSVSGLETNKFVFLGFLPKKKRKKLFKWLSLGKVTFAFYESPNRIVKTLEALKDFFGEDTKVFMARELTKVYETLCRGTVKEVLGDLGNKKIKGEIVVVANG